MRSARRLASVAVVASLAVTGLSACRSAPSVAAYVGDLKITEARVTDVFDEVRDAAPAPAASAQTQAAAAPSITRADAARVLVSAEILPKVAAQEGVTLPADLKLSDFAQALNAPESSEYVRLFAEEYSYTAALRAKVTSGPAPTDADLHEVYDALIALGQEGTFEQFKSSISQENTQVVQQAIAVRQQIEQVADPLHVKINPRYSSLGIPVVQTQTQSGAIVPLIVAPLGDDTSVPVSAAH